MGNYCCSNENNTQEKFVTTKTAKRDLSETARSINYIQIYILTDTSKKLKDGKNFARVAKIAEGGQSTVYLARLWDSEPNGGTPRDARHDEYIALKQISKSHLLEYYQVASIVLENTIMKSLDSKFIEKLEGELEDQSYIYLLKKVARGGDLYSLLENTDVKGLKFKKLQGQGLRFVLRGIVLGLEALHAHNIIYRDLKTENVLINEQGYPYLTDFGLSIRNNYEITSIDRRGTDLYMAPQMLYRDLSYDLGVDLWALGVLIYFMLYGEYPYTKKEIHSYDYMQLTRQRENKYHKTPYSSKFFKDNQNFKEDLHNLMNQLLQTNPKDRIGYYGISKVKDHPFFKSPDEYWKKYESQEILSPLMPIIGDAKIRYEQLSERMSVSDNMGTPETRCSCNQEVHFGNWRAKHSYWHEDNN